MVFLRITVKLIETNFFSWEEVEINRKKKCSKGKHYNWFTHLKNITYENEKLVIHRNKGVSFVLTPLKDENEDCFKRCSKRAIDKDGSGSARRVMSNAEARKINLLFLNKC
jgi:hypothetical protein